MSLQTCAQCGSPMVCQPEGDCWCKQMPPVLPLPEEAARCLCPACLGQAMERRAE